MSVPQYFLYICDKTSVIHPRSFTFQGSTVHVYALKFYRWVEFTDTGWSHRKDAKLFWTGRTSQAPVPLIQPRWTRAIALGTYYAWHILGYGRYTATTIYTVIVVYRFHRKRFSYCSSAARDTRWSINYYNTRTDAIGTICITFYVHFCDNMIWI